MKYDVVLTAKVKRQLQHMLNDLELRFGRKAAIKLFHAFTVVISSLEHFPQFGSIVDGHGTRKCVLRGKSILFYKVDGNVVSVLALRDGRQAWKG
jgi:plasmid stabilization system protein ParE